MSETAERRYAGIVSLAVLSTLVVGLGWTANRVRGPDRSGAARSDFAVEARTRKAAEPRDPADAHGSVRASSIVRNARDGLDYAELPAGSFAMGCVDGDDACDRDERPRHTVRFDAGFAITTTEVTVAAYRRFVAATDAAMPEPPTFDPDWSRGDHPIVNVRMPDAAAYCRWARGRLPTEAEWEYAARGGRDGSLYPTEGACEDGGANVTGLRGPDRWETTAPVASFPANGFGLYDMGGNVWEWVLDAWHDGYDGAPADGSAWGSGRITGPGQNAAVVRGGSWLYGCRQMRSSHRGRWFWPGNRFDDYGFRCVLD